MMSLLQSLSGIVVIVLISYLFSENRSHISWRFVLKGLFLQFSLTIILLKLSIFQSLFHQINNGILAIQDGTKAGTSLVFGYLGGGPLPFIESNEGMSFILGFQALPMMLVISALSAVLYYLRILPIVIGIFAWFLGRLLGISGPASFAVISTIFVGMVEAPLLIRPYLKELSRTELFIIMSSGMATISGTVLVIYAGFLSSVIPNSSEHLIVASIISAPAAIMLSMTAIPPTDPTIFKPRFSDAFYIKHTSHFYTSIMDAITQGTIQGLKLLVNVIAMLIVLVALVSILNSLLNTLPNVFDSPLSLQRMIGWVMAPFAWCLGIEAKDIQIAGKLLGTKLVLNEFIAYLELSKISILELSEKSRILLTYLLCGFANFGSLGIVIGGLTSMIPERSQEVLSLGFRSLLVGTLATSLSGIMAGIVLFTESPW